jgi:polyisoprenoid-binding protein YceI
MKAETKWSIDQAHSQIAFKVRHLMIAHVNGTFKTFDASIYTTDKNFFTAQIDLWIDASSISTGDSKRDEHLKSVDFLDVENHKQITFTSSTIEKSRINGTHELWGELTIRGVTKNVKMDVAFGGNYTDSLGVEKAGFSISGIINRKDWELEWNSKMETGGVMVGDDVSIFCEIELINIGFRDLTIKIEPKTTQMSM